ncbi:MAG: hypothetical protein IKG37_11250 [Solobacterium sp.]|nr:hypothetical protein [Solobacterium sp.]
MINLYPWNLYLFLAAIIGIIAVLVTLGKPLLKLKQTADVLLEKLGPIEKNTAALKTKTDQVSSIGKNLLSNAKLVLTGYILLRALRKQDPAEPMDSDRKPRKLKVARKGLSSRDLDLIKTIQKF